MADTLTVLVDTREQYPLIFPSTYTTDCPRRQVYRVEVKQQKLDAGDYQLQNYPGCIIERKGSQAELIKNLFDYKDSMRQARSFNRLTENCQHPYILVEVSPQNILDGQMLEGCKVANPQLIMDRLCHVMARYGLNLLMCSKPTTPNARRALGTMALSIMLAHRERDKTKAEQFTEDIDHALAGV